MKSSELLRKLKRAGWKEIKQEGSHIRLEHKDFAEPIYFPFHGAKEMKKGMEQAILKQAGLK